ncbi:STAS domain-containing protein [Pseudomonadota bacterium]
MSITYSVSEDKRHVDIRVAGRFDFSSHQEFRDAYSQVNPATVSFNIDLSQTEYLDSAALGMLLVLRERAGGDKADIRLTGCNESVQQIMDITRFERLFSIE